MIQRRGQAKVGDKTMVDVWAPVVDDLKENHLTPERIDEYVLATAHFKVDINPLFLYNKVSYITD